MRFRKVVDSLGAVATEDIQEGRMCILKDHSQSHNYGSREDLPGAALPSTSDEASEALYMAAIPPTEQRPPIFDSYPTIEGSMRQGFADNSNSPFNADVYTTPPNMLEGQTISSGSLVALHAGGTYTVESGNYVYNASIVPGARLTVEWSGADAGKLKHTATADDGVAVTIEHDTSERELTFRMVRP